MDVDLSAQGREEAREAGRLLRAEGIAFDIAFSSVLKRAIRTLWIALDEMDQMWLPVERSWRFNERHYGALQGLDKAQTVERHGAEQVKIWRRSYDIPPPPLPLDDPRPSALRSALRQRAGRGTAGAESLKDTLARVLPYWNSTHRARTAGGPQRARRRARQQPARAGQDARRDVRRGIVEFNIPTGVPLLYELDDDLKPRVSRYLGDADAVKARAEAVARQAEARRRKLIAPQVRKPPSTTSNSPVT